MSRNLSVFLDLLRLSAALLVLIGHAGEVYGMNLPALLGHSAKEGVAIFFVLSGFVIAFVTQRKEQDWRTFAKARALRMYSVVPLAVLFLVICHAAGSRLDPGLYEPGSGRTNGGAIGTPPTAFAILRYLSFTNEIWFDRAMMSTGAPFWSLGFEVAYYVGFAVLFYARGPWRWGFAALWLAVCGPRIALAFPLWLIGVCAWALVRKGWRIRPATCGLGLVLLALAALAWRRTYAMAAMPLFEWGATGPLAASMGYYLILATLLAAAIVVFAAGVPDRLIWPQWAARVIAYCAGASFTLYIGHLPAMVLIAAVWPASIGSLAEGLAATGMAVAITFGLAELGERRKATYALIFSRISTMFPGCYGKSISAID